MIDFKSLETISLVAQLGSFKTAAARLNTTQPAISIRIAKTEAALGVSLFERGHRSIVLTPAGRQIVGYAERLLSLRSDMIQAIAHSSGMRGTFRLGVSESIVHTWLPAFLECLHTTYPKLTIEIEVDISANLHTRLCEQKIDLAFMLGPVTGTSIVSRPLCQFPLRFLASPALRLHGRTIALDELRVWPLITFSRNTQPYADISDLFPPSDKTPPRIYASSSLATVVRMTLDGIGVAVIPPAIVQTELAGRKLAELKLSARIPDLHFVAAWMKTSDRHVIENIATIAARTAAQKTARRKP